MDSLDWSPEWTSVETRTVLLAAVVFLVVFRLLRRPRNLPPGPWGWPLVGNLPGLMTSGEEMHVTLSKMSARYGNVVHLNMAGVPVVALHDYNTVREAFSQHQLSARPTLHISQIYGPSGIGIISSSGPEAVEIRRFTLNTFKSLGMSKSSFEQNISAEAESLVEELMKCKEEAFDPKHLFDNAVSNVVCSVVLGKRFQYDDLSFKRLLQVLSDNMEGGGSGLLMEILPIFTKLKMLPFVRRYFDLTRSYHKHIRLLVEHHEQDMDHPKDFIDVFLSEMKRKEEQGAEPLSLKNVSLVRMVGDLIIGGSETVATTLGWVMLYMMAHPEVQARVQRELDGVTARNRFPRISDKPSLPYTEAVLSEIQRIQTIAPLALPHRCSEDTTLLGFNIPKGTMVMSNIWHNHNDPSVWEQPEVFHPERFLDEDGKFRSREQFTPFGIGRRICLGENLARMELFIFYTRLLHQFTIKKPNDVPSVSFQGTIGVTWAPANFTMCAVARES